MELLGYVKDFTNYIPQQLEQMKKDLELVMPLPMLNYVASYYRTQAKRDPQVDELKLLDSLFYKASTAADAIAPIEVLTNDSFVAQTYADLMQKRALCQQNTNAPLSFAQALNMPSQYLKRIGKYEVSYDTIPVLERTADAPFSSVSRNVFLSEDGELRLRLLKKAKRQMICGDVILLLLPTEQSSNVDYQIAMSELLATPLLSEQLLQLCKVDKKGLLHAILSIAYGAEIRLSALSRKGEAVSLFTLISDCENCYLMRVPQNAVADISGFAQTKGLYTASLATANADATLRIVRTNQESFALDTVFLRSLIYLRTVRAQLQNEEPTQQLTLTHTFRNPQSNRYLTDAQALPARETISYGDLTVASAHTQPKSSFFLHALYSVLVPVSQLALCGADYSKQALSLYLNIPKHATDPATAGEICSMILGFYRAQAELALPAMQSTVEFAENLLHPTLSVISTAASRPTLPTALQKSGARVYLVALDLDDTGMPSFHMLRKLLGDLCAWYRSGRILSAKLILEKTPIEALTAMKTDTLQCEVTDTRVETTAPLRLAFLIESEESLPLCSIGTVVSVGNQKGTPSTENNGAEPTDEVEALDPSKDSECIQRGPSLIWSEKTAVTVVANREDTDAQLLVSILNQNGADATLFLADGTQNGALSRALLTSQIVLFCQSVTLPEDKRIQFAMKVMKQAGGLAIAFDEASTDASICLPHGLTRENLDVICQK